ncbi:hypothetical protein [Actinokineospora sp.]|uniref:hypothetical protein n=1 Tax=Actinokineospora sp. TaxID=1872133 RepID=UPI0040379AEA
MISRVAVLPHPPLLVPELVGGRDVDADAVRVACVGIARALARTAPRWFAVGSGAAAARFGPVSSGTFRGFGVDVRVALGSRADLAFADPTLPLPVLVAGWLRGQVGADEVTAAVIPADLDPAECAAEGRRITDELAGDAPVGLLVLGDGSHRHGERAVGRPDDRAGDFDARAAAAFAAADAAALLDLDPALAADLGASGRGPWQVLAGAVHADGRAWRCARSNVSVPFGVAYHFAEWEPVAA